MTTAFPPLLAVTTPREDTLATDGFLDIQTTLFLFSCLVSPRIIVIFFAEAAIALCGTKNIRSMETRRIHRICFAYFCVSFLTLTILPLSRNVPQFKPF